ncbi:N-acetylneuraminate synthase family protein [Candidatus Pelagibacter sp. Uisw_114]|tara:strand:- start:17923 stop:18777 length:855 start_codon:yes stop_codon:yes gene_type:complete
MKNKDIVEIDGIKIGRGMPIPIIAEIGVNHLGSLARAKKMVDLANQGGADFIKFQTYDSKNRYDLKKNPKAKKFIELTKEWELSQTEESELWKYARKKKAKLFTSVYDYKMVNFAEKLNTIAYKIAAFEITNIKLIKEIIKTKKPVIISCGMTNIKEIKKIVKPFEDNKIKYILLHTVSSYPLQKIHSNLKKIYELKENFNCPVGHSDHTPGSDIPPLAVAAGAQIIEKHFTDEPKHRESDNFFSITCSDLRDIKFKVNQAYEYIYSPDFEKADPEKFMRSFRK